MASGVGAWRERVGVGVRRVVCCVWVEVVVVVELGFLEGLLVG